VPTLPCIDNGEAVIKDDIAFGVIRLLILGEVVISFIVALGEGTRPVDQVQLWEVVLELRPLISCA
jgi:hypothetical protein